MLRPFPSKVRALLREQWYPAAWGGLYGLALVLSLFFNGSHIQAFSLTFLTVSLLALLTVARGYGAGLTVPKTALALTLTLFWAWLAATLFWAAVPYVSVVNFWWVGAPVLVFWLATLAPSAERVWHWSSRATLLVGLFLAGMGLYQLLVLGTDPRSTFLSRNSHAALLILIALPAAGHFLTARRDTRGEAQKFWFLAAAVYLLFQAIAVTGSRGVLLSMLASVAVMGALTRRQVARRRLIAFFGIIAFAYLVANVILRGWLVERLGTIFDPSDAGYDRFLIWGRSWKMLMDSPWLGVGLGTYWLHWPPYRHPDDSSAGFYAHNDYLQIWIETGLPGLLLLLAVYVSLVAVLVRLLRSPHVGPQARVEAVALFGGLLAIATHTFFDFDLYILPILFVLGLLLARLHFLYATRVAPDRLSLNPARRFGARAYYTIAFLMVLFPALYFAALGLSAHFMYKARDLATQGKWVDSSVNLTRAWQLMPTSDLTLVSHADLLRQAIPALPPNSEAERRTIYREAVALLADAEQVNPVRPQTYFILALLYQHNPELAGKDWADKAARAFQAALRVDPRAHWARMAYAQMLLGLGRPAQAKQILEEGIQYWYMPEPGVFSYYALTAQLRWQSGDKDGAVALEQKKDRMLMTAGRRQDPFGGIVTLHLNASK